MLLEFIQAFVLLIVIMDPLVSMAAFLSMTKNLRSKERNAIIVKAVLVAAIPLFLFIVFGNVLLDIMRVDIDTFRAAGGLILVLLGMQLAFGRSFHKNGDPQSHNVGAIAAIIGTPLITGPATIAASILLSNELGKPITALAAIVALVTIFILLRLCSLVHKHLGVTGIRVLSTMMGLVTVAWGIAFIKEGLLTG